MEFPKSLEALKDVMVGAKSLDHALAKLKSDVANGKPVGDPKDIKDFEKLISKFREHVQAEIEGIARMSLNLISEQYNRPD